MRPTAMRSRESRKKSWRRRSRCFFIRKSWEKWVRMVDAVQYFHFVAADVIYIYDTLMNNCEVMCFLHMFVSRDSLLGKQTHVTGHCQHIGIETHRRSVNLGKESLWGFYLICSNTWEFHHPATVDDDDKNGHLGDTNSGSSAGI